MLALKTELEVAQELAARVRTARLQLGWSQDELARRAGLRPATYRLFEQTGRIALLRLLRVLSVLGRFAGRRSGVRAQRCAAFAR